MKHNYYKGGMDEEIRFYRLYMGAGVVICLCAIAEFIFWIVDASKLHMPNQVVMGCGLLSVTVGALQYILLRRYAGRVTNVLLWICIIACIILFFIGIALTPGTADVPL